MADEKVSQSTGIIEVIGTHPASEALRSALKDAEEYARESLALNTRRAYELDRDHYKAWCEENDLVEAAGNPITVAAFLSRMAKGGAAASSVKRAASGIAYYLRALDPVTWPPNAWPPAVKSVIRGIGRRHGRPPNARDAAVLKIVTAMVPHLGEGLRGLRNRAVILVGFWCAMRRSEIVGLDRDDVSFDAAGMTVMIRRGKTDQEGEGRLVGAKHAKNDDICAPCALARWIRAAKIADGPLFRGISVGGELREKRLDARHVHTLVCDGVRAAGFDPKRFGAHSLRAGFVTTAAAKGKSLDSIMRQTGHESAEQARQYIRHATIFDDNATEDLE